MSTSVETDPSMIEEEVEDGEEVNQPTPEIPVFELSSDTSARRRPTISHTPGPGNARVRAMRENYQAQIAALQQDNQNLRTDIMAERHVNLQLNQLWQEAGVDYDELMLSDNMNKRIIHGLKKEKEAMEEKYVSVVQRQRVMRQKYQAVKGKHESLKRKNEEQNAKVQTELLNLEDRAQVAFQAVQEDMYRVRNGVYADNDLSDVTESFNQGEWSM